MHFSLTCGAMLRGHFESASLLAYRYCAALALAFRSGSCWRLPPRRCSRRPFASCVHRSRSSSMRYCCVTIVRLLVATVRVGVIHATSHTPSRHSATTRRLVALALVGTICTLSLRSSHALPLTATTLVAAVNRTPPPRSCRCRFAPVSFSLAHCRAASIPIDSLLRFGSMSHPRGQSACSQSVHLPFVSR